MTTCRFLSAALIAVLLPFGHAGAGSYEPGSFSFELEPGGTVSVEYTYSSDPVWSFFLQPYALFEGSTELESWFVVNAPRGTDGKAEVMISVPLDATPGEYEGTIYGAWETAHRVMIDPIGLPIFIKVSSGCSGQAEFVASSDNDFQLWAPNHTKRSVELLGELRIPGGCSILSATYEVVDEYGEYSSTGDLEISADPTGYRAMPLVEVSRRGNDIDGRHYTVTLSVETEAGVAIHTRSIVVLHDRRDKADKSR